MKSKLINLRFLLKGIGEKGFFHLLSANVLIQLFSFASQLLVAGILSPDDVGRIKIIQSYLSIFSVIAGMGFNASTLKICSENRSESENRDFLNTALGFTLISSTIVYLLILLLNYLKIFSTDLLIIMLVPAGLFPVISNSLYVTYIAYFQAIKEIKLYSYLTIFNKIISISAIILLTYFWGIKGYYLAFNLGFILMILIIFFRIKKDIPLSFSFNWKEKYKQHSVYARENLLAAIISELSGYMDIILIGWMIKNMDEIGYYSFALTLTIALRIFPSTVQQITIPYFSSFESGKEKFMEIFKKYNRLLFTVIIISLILFLLFVPPILQIIYGNKYENSVNYLFYLAIGWSFRNLNQLQSGAIFGLGKIKYNAFIGVLVLIFNCLVYPISIYHFGITGVAYASIPSGIVFLFASRYYFNKAVKETKWNN